MDSGRAVPGAVNAVTAGGAYKAGVVNPGLSCTAGLSSAPRAPGPAAPSADARAPPPSRASFSEGIQDEAAYQEWLQYNAAAAAAAAQQLQPPTAPPSQHPPLADGLGVVTGAHPGQQVTSFMFAAPTQLGAY